MTTLQERLEHTKNRIGLVGTRLNFSRPADGKGISEHITHDWQEVVIKIKRDLDLCPDEETKRYLEKRKITDPVEKVATDLLYHGCGHRELPTETGLGCPYTVFNHDKILSGVSKALKEIGKVGLESYVSNAFEDVLDITNAKRHTDMAGQILFWNNEGLENKNQFTDFYEAFVRVNLSLMGEPMDATLLRRFYLNNDKTKKAVAEFKDYLKSKLGTDNLVRIHQKEDLFRRLFDKTQWEEVAYRFTKALGPLLEDQPKMRLCFGKNPGEASPFDQQLKLPQIMEDVAYGRYKSGEGPSEHTDSQLQLDALYRKMSRALPVRTSDYTRASGVPVAHYGRRYLGDGEEVKITRVKGIGFGENGDLALRVTRHELKHPAEFKVHPRKFPKLKIALIDTSGSMGEDPSGGRNVGNTTFIPWGDNSKYHYALKGLYGIDNFLEKQGVAPYVESEAIVFSGSTATSGRRKLRSDEERRLLLRTPSGGTTLDTNFINSSAEKEFLISVSDGAISNWSSIKDAYKKAVEKKDYCHIHIGAANDFTRDLESWGIKVNYVKGDDDLSRLMLDATSKYYREGDFK